MCLKGKVKPNNADEYLFFPYFNFSWDAGLFCRVETQFCSGSNLLGWHVGCWRHWDSPALVPAGNVVQNTSLLNISEKTIHGHYHHHHFSIVNSKTLVDGMKVKLVSIGEIWRYEYKACIEQTQIFNVSILVLF